ncbi:c-type cytochrome [Variovorax sp. OV329]|uniref:c-type cytochrome n=1 Tax=Variovorax sp. OV329 TaxID=1882825 RepID=UPI0008EAC7F6|nr:c-type cytochrome [Variovorax sp. OV329]SFN40033.1 hypothetical protein SAMN05444747_12466 [Variovorax sp. OV329]
MKSLLSARFAPLVLSLAASCTWAQGVSHPPAPASAAERGRMIERGRYLVQVAGCNDCHTPGYGQDNGKVPEKLWLTGDVLGWRGPWGTTYPSNLRIYIGQMSEAQWLDVARHFEPRPPMPWFNVRAMSDTDLRAIYLYVVALGPAGSPAPAYVPPGQAPAGPFVQFPQ